eukprot:GCRY01001280.1.p1 GENE.GCRY01001280.1~~GCRY01001280.1.p1  ORF type:complete len:352 (+),score=33.31 GCRY01001280.1:161-1216(+)
MSLHTAAWAIAGVFALLACLFSLVLIYRHLINFSVPLQQVPTIRILLMVPIYAIDSWISLRFPSISLYVDTFRDVYEAVVIYTFLQLCMEYVGGDTELARKISDDPPQKHPWPLDFLTFHPGPRFLLSCKRGVLQYCWIKPVTAFLTAILEAQDVYGDGDLTVGQGYLYIMLINNISVTISLYYLVLFYVGCQKILKPYRPVLKFLCIKSVIFFSWWQGVGLAVLARLGILDGVGGYQEETVAMGIQDFLICVEMFFASLAHIWAFPADDYIVKDDDRVARTPLISSILDVVDPRDLFSDSVDTFRQNGRLSTPITLVSELDHITVVEDFAPNENIHSMAVKESLVLHETI